MLLLSTKIIHWPFTTCVINTEMNQNISKRSGNQQEPGKVQSTVKKTFGKFLDQENQVKKEKSRIRETQTLSTDADSRTDTNLKRSREKEEKRNRRQRRSRKIN